MVVATERPRIGEENLHSGPHRVHVEARPSRGHRPFYYFPPEDVRQDVLEPTDQHTRCPYKGEASYWTVRVGDKVAENVMWGYQDPLPERADIRGYRAFYWEKADAWYEGVVKG